MAAQLEQNPFLNRRSVRVSVQQRRVVLEGVVDTPEASLRAEKDALSIEGVYA
ncbi:MAG: BON domain-containing protein, partial [Rhizobiaceae bacterium]|nr:BON domain-containing protein [Rhizobiaceae bacterium]